MINNLNRCWCGNDLLKPFSEDYLRCTVCETLVLKNIPEDSLVTVSEDEKDFYGKNYWFDHQKEDLGNDTIITRSRSDLVERCLYWLLTLLRYKLPPGKTLELGSAHGGFVQLMKWVGYDATGLELSPWIVAYAKKTFDIPVLLGPIEKQIISPTSLDSIVLMDVLEHLQDPVNTIVHCVSLLKPNGIIYLQTPCYPVGMSYEEMVVKGHPFLIQLKPPEHIYLFSQQSLAIFLSRVGMTYQSFEPAIFSHYDMSVVAGSKELYTNTNEDIEEYLSSGANRRLVLALLDQYIAKIALKDKLTESEIDRAIRLENNQKMERRLIESEVDRSTLLESLHDLEKLLKESEADRAARLESIHSLERILKESEADRAARLESIHSLERILKESEADRSARLEIINNLNANLKTLEDIRQNQLQNISQLQIELDKPIWSHFWHILKKLRGGDNHDGR